MEEGIIDSDDKDAPTSALDPPRARPRLHPSCAACIQRFYVCDIIFTVGPQRLFRRTVGYEWLDDFV